MNICLPQVSTISAEAEIGALRHGVNMKVQDSNRIFKEMFWHRHAVNYLAMGMSNKETADSCQVEVATINSLLKMEWFNERVKQKMEELGYDLINMFKAEGMASLQTLVEVRDNDKASNRDKLTAATTILDRVLGKATQYVEVKSEHVNSNPVAHIESLQKQVQSLRGELKILPICEANAEVGPSIEPSSVPFSEGKAEGFAEEQSRFEKVLRASPLSD